jgi:hypothetical protein
MFSSLFCYTFFILKLNLLFITFIQTNCDEKGVQFTDGYTSNVFGETIESARSTDSTKGEEIYEIVPNSLAKYQARAYMHTPTEGTKTKKQNNIYI